MDVLGELEEKQKIPIEPLDVVEGQQPRRKRTRKMSQKALDALAKARAVKETNDPKRKEKAEKKKKFMAKAGAFYREKGDDLELDLDAPFESYFVEKKDTSQIEQPASDLHPEDVNRMNDVEVEAHSEINVESVKGEEMDLAQIDKDVPRAAIKLSAENQMLINNRRNVQRLNRGVEAMYFDAPVRAPRDGVVFL